MIALAMMGVALLSAPVARADSHEEPAPAPREPAPEEESTPTLFGDVNTVDDFFAALTDAGFGPLALQEIAVTRPWIPVPSAGVLALDGAEVEVFALSADEADTAIANLSGDGSAFQPPANVTIWRGLEFVLILRDAPSQSTVEQLITRIVGSPMVATIAGPPLLPPSPDAGTDGDGAAQPEAATDPPSALPATGNGGLVGVTADSGGLSTGWIAAGVGLAVAIALATVGLGAGRFRAGRERS